VENFAFWYDAISIFIKSQVFYFKDVVEDCSLDQRLFRYTRAPGRNFFILLLLRIVKFHLNTVGFHLMNFGNYLNWQTESHVHGTFMASWKVITAAVCKVLHCTVLHNLHLLLYVSGTMGLAV
jgi:hypothetical protein